MRYRLNAIAIVTLVTAATLIASFGVAAPPPTAPPTPVRPLPDLSLQKVPFHFVNLWVLDASKAQPVQAVAQANNATWPIIYDLRPKTLIHLTWVADGFPQAKIPDLLAGKGDHSLGLALNGRVLQRGPDGLSGEYYAYAVNPGAPSLYGCPPGKTCLGASIQATTWNSISAPWQLELQLWKRTRVQPQQPQVPILGPCPGDPTKLCPQPPPGPEPIKIKASVKRSGPEVSYFAAKLYPTFQHDRCRTCHYLLTPAGLINQHKAIGIGGVTQISTPRGTLLTCGGGCHYPHQSDFKIDEILQYVPGGKFDDQEWKAPGADMGINWTGKSAVEICTIIRNKLPSAQALKHHFHDDIRIAWAVHSGRLPAGRPPRPVAPPGSYQEWKKITTAWIDSGSPCPW